MQFSAEGSQHDMRHALKTLVAVVFAVSWLLAGQGLPHADIDIASGTTISDQRQAVAPGESAPHGGSSPHAVWNCHIAIGSCTAFALRVDDRSLFLKGGVEKLISPRDMRLTGGLSPEVATPPPRV